MSQSPPSSPFSRLAILLVIALGIPLFFSGCNLALSAAMAKLSFGCLPEGQLIDTPTGPRAIEKIQTGDEVIGFTGEAVAVLQIHQYRENPETAPYLAVSFESGTTIKLSPHHRIAGVAADDLNSGDTLAGFTVDRIERVSGVSRSYDLLTEDGGYQIGGVPVNSMIEEMASIIAAN